jgi:hypothetical protein
MTHSYVRRDSFIHETYWVISAIRRMGACVGSWVYHIAHSYVWHDVWAPHLRQFVSVSHGSSICETWLSHEQDANPSSVRYETCMTNKCNTTHGRLRWFVSVSWDSCICVIPCMGLTLASLYPMTHPYVRHDSVICQTWLSHKCDTTHGRLRWFVSVSWDSCICVIPCMGASLAFFITCLIWSHDSFICETWLVHMSDVTGS